MSGGQHAHAMRRTGIKVSQRIAIEDIEPIAIPRGPKGRCGRCQGLIASEKLFGELISTCRNCGREATPIDCGVINRSGCP